jgi:hypothetical protein
MPIYGTGGHLHHLPPFTPIYPHLRHRRSWEAIYAHIPIYTHMPWEAIYAHIPIYTHMP